MNLDQTRLMKFLQYSRENARKMENLSTAKQLDYVLNSKEVLKEMADLVVDHDGKMLPLSSLKDPIHELLNILLTNEQQQNHSQPLDLYDPSTENNMRELQQIMMQNPQKRQHFFDSMTQNIGALQKGRCVQKHSSGGSEELIKENEKRTIPTVAPINQMENPRAKDEHSDKETQKKEKQKKNQHRSGNQPSKYSDAKPFPQDNSNDKSSCEFTLEYDKNGELVNTGSGADDLLKRNINNQIVKALESYKLNENAEVDLANVIAKTIEKNNVFIKEIQDLQDANKPKQIEEEELVEDDENNVQPTDRDTPIISKYPSTGSNDYPSEAAPSKNTTNGSKSSKKKKKKKKKKKENHANDKNRRKGGEVDADWVCEFCEYEKVFGVKPICLMNWFDRKMADQEKRDMYQRHPRRRESRNREEHTHSGKRSTKTDQQSLQMAASTPPP
ncbi:hypothetical protein FOA43_001434 [Brettanomyces nanus]|uniref:Uncharacterized protein n=1 Tax=Eeniella nana TaxID=13502 RepID=A0A875S1Z7_EENNA|nr:uncharacterized protein FOA43_001434 [Brettanomyces nanus]QPG74112.1 hypothetical protein FOA43_001434 [Brettanomyces nanus]